MRGDGSIVLYIRVGLGMGGSCGKRDIVEKMEGKAGGGGFNVQISNNA